MILIYLRNLCASTSIHKLVNWLSGRNSFGVSSLYVQLIVSFRTEPVKWGVNVFTTGQKQVFRKPVSFFHIIKLALNTIQRLRYGSLSPNLQWLKYLVYLKQICEKDHSTYICGLITTKLPTQLRTEDDNPSITKRTHTAFFPKATVVIQSVTHTHATCCLLAALPPSSAYVPQLITLGRSIPQLLEGAPEPLPRRSV